MSIVACIVLLAVGLAGVRGAFRGLTGEVAQLLGMVAFVGVFFFGHAPLSEQLAKVFPGLEPQAHAFYAALGVMLLGGGVFFAVAGVTRRVGECVCPQPFNAILGALLGGAKMVLIVSLVAGTIGAANDWIRGLREAPRSENPISVAALDFWEERFSWEALQALWQPEAPEKGGRAP